MTKSSAYGVVRGTLESWPTSHDKMALAIAERLSLEPLDAALVAARVVGYYPNWLYRASSPEQRAWVKKKGDVL